MPPKPLHERLRAAREAAGITQDELAYHLRQGGDERFASTNGTRIGEWERRTPRIPFYVVDALAHALGQPLSYFSEYPASSVEASKPPGAASDLHLEERLEAAEEAIRAYLAARRQADSSA